MSISFFRIAAVGILVTILVQVLKHSGRDEQAFLITLAGLILVLGWVIPYIYDLFETIKKSVFAVKGGRVMAVVQAALLGLTAVLLAAQLKPLKPEYAVYLVLAASIGVGFLGLARLGCAFGHPAGDRKRDQDPACVSGGVIQDGGNHIYRRVHVGDLQGCRILCGGDPGGDGWGSLAILAVSAPVVLSLVETLKVFME